MPLASLSPSSSVTFGDNHPPPHSQGEARSFAGPSDGAMPETPAPAPLTREGDEPAAFVTLIKTDLSGLAALQSWNEPRAPAEEPSAVEFLGAFARLLSSVREGDKSGARDAADALQFQLFAGAQALDAERGEAAEAQARMLDAFRNLVGAARQGDIGEADRAARSLAHNLQSALLAPASRPTLSNRAQRPRASRPVSARETTSLVQGVTAAYETQMDVDANAA